MRPLLATIAVSLVLAACSQLIPPPTATPLPTPTPIPTFGLAELDSAFTDLSVSYRKVDPTSITLRSASHNNTFDHQLAFINDAEGTSFSVSLGQLTESEQEDFDYTVSQQWETASEDLRAANIARGIGLFRVVIGNTGLGNRTFDGRLANRTELREVIVLRRYDVGIVVKFSQSVVGHVSPTRQGIITDPEMFLSVIHESNCGTAYICRTGKPNFVTALDAATVIDNAVLRFYRDIDTGGNQ